MTTQLVTADIQSATILRDITIDHGPSDLLAPLFLRLEYAVRQLGLGLNFGSLERLAAVNAANRGSWLKLFPVFDPTFWPSDNRGDTFCLFAHEPSGRTVATIAVRFFDWHATTLHEEARSLRLFYSDVQRFRGAAETCTVTAPLASKISGRVAFAGAVWVHPDWRKHTKLMTLVPRFARAYCIAKWDVEHYALLMTEGVFKGGLAKKTGLGNVDWAVDMKGCPLGDLRLGVLDMTRTDLHDDLSRCLVELSSEVEMRNVPHGTQNQQRA